MNNLKISLAKIEKNIANFAISNSKVSKVNMGWHIEHSLLVINNILDSLTHSDPKQYKKKFHLIRTIILFFKGFPRGKGTAPQSTLPSNNIDVNSLLEHLQQTKQKLSATNILHSHSNFTHPLLGMLNLKETLEFLSVHTNHHLSIMNDIKKANHVK
jgi:hypothetical protein